MFTTELDFIYLISSPNCIPFQTWSNYLNMGTEMYQQVMISE